jgi:soluble lytic murein transglycosylase-like protein
MKRFVTMIYFSGALVSNAAPAAAKQMPVSADLAQLIARHAQEHNVPETLVYRVAERESGLNPKVHHLTYWGLMQISGVTARRMGYSGPLEGLLDADTNLTYAVPYLAGAYSAAHGDERRAMMFYSRGYYSKRRR